MDTDLQQELLNSLQEILIRLDFNSCTEARTAVSRRIDELKDSAREKFRQRVETEAVELGLSLTEVLNSLRHKAPKYRNHENPNETWSGRGKRPTWVTKALEQGTPLESLLSSQ